MNNVDLLTGVKNAGLVLLNNYVPLLFARLGITTSNQFINETAQFEAVYYLQYLVTGLVQTDESFLSLNKLLCGLSLSLPIQNGIDISNENKSLTTG